MKKTKRTNASIPSRFSHLISHFLLLSSCFLLAFPAVAQPPALINYQGRLVDGTNLVNGTLEIEMRLYDAASGGTLLYTGANPAVTVIDGLYDLHIGENTTFGTLSAALESSQVWLQVVVNGTPLSPRERLVSVPYAMQAGSVGAGSIGFNQLAQPYQAGRIELEGLSASGPSFLDEEVPSFLNEDIAFSPAFSAPPIVTAGLQIGDPITLASASASVLSATTGGATLRIGLPRVHQQLGVGATFRDSFAIVDGHPAVVGFSGGEIRYQRALDPAGIAWGPVQAVASHSAVNHLVMAEINGHPAIAWVSGPGAEPGLFYVRASDQQGVNWPAKLKIEDPPGTSSLRYLSMTEVNNRPGIAYESNQAVTVDETTFLYQTWFVIANDSAGASWAAPVLVHAVNDMHPFSRPGRMTPRLMIADTLPAILYGQSFAGFNTITLTFRRSQNTIGSSWGGPVTVATVFTETIIKDNVEFDVGVVAGNPAVLYVDPEFDFGSPVLYFRRASNSIGDSWASAWTVPGAIELEDAVSLWVVDGFPAAAVAGSQDLLYRRSWSSTGNGWYAAGPDLSHPAIGAPGPVNLLVVDGEPAMVYGNRYLRSTQLPVGAVNWFAVLP